MEEILGHPNTGSKNEQALKDMIQYWESKRPLFNIVVGVSGLIPMLIFSEIAFDQDFSLILFVIGIYGILANICFCLGWGIPILRWHYFKNTDFGKYKKILIVAGLLFSIGLTLALSTGTWFAIGLEPILSIGE